MRKKETRLVFTYKNTVDAMMMEKLCQEAGAPGRLIPIPSVVSAGCGLCWAAEPSNREELTELMREHGLEPEGVYEVFF